MIEKKEEQKVELKYKLWLLVSLATATVLFLFIFLFGIIFLIQFNKNCSDNNALTVILCVF